MSKVHSTVILQESDHLFDILVNCPKLINNKFVLQQIANIKNLKISPGISPLEIPVPVTLLPPSHWK